LLIVSKSPFFDPYKGVVILISNKLSLTLLTSLFRAPVDHFVFLFPPPRPLSLFQWCLSRRPNIFSCTETCRILASTAVKHGLPSSSHQTGRDDKASPGSPRRPIAVHRRVCGFSAILITLDLGCEDTWSNSRQNIAPLSHHCSLLEQQLSYDGPLS